MSAQPANTPRTRTAINAVGFRAGMGLLEFLRRSRGGPLAVHSRYRPALVSRSSRPKSFDAYLPAYAIQENGSAAGHRSVRLEGFPRPALGELSTSRRLYALSIRTPTA